MADNTSPSEQNWECGWESHRHAQVLRLAQMPFSEKLMWLEQAHHLMRHLTQARFGKIGR